MKNIIYRIRNIISGRSYVGSAHHGGPRWNSHRHLLRCGKHHSPPLQHSWNKHGADSFVFEVLEKVDDTSDLLRREQYWIDALRTADPDIGFNVSPVAGTRRGVRQPPSVAAKLRDVHSGKPKSSDHRKKIGDANRGRKMSIEQRAVVSDAVSTRFSDPGERQRQSDRMLGTPNAMKGRRHSEASRANIRTGIVAGLEANPDRVERLRAMSAIAASKRKTAGVSEAERAAKRAVWAARSPEEILEIKRKSWETRRAKAAAEGRHTHPVGQKRSEETRAKMRGAWERRKAATAAPNQGEA